MKQLLNWWLGGILILIGVALVSQIFTSLRQVQVPDGEYLVEDVDQSTWSSLCQNARGLTGWAYLRTTYGPSSELATRLAQLVVDGKVSPPSTRFKLKAASEYGVLSEIRNSENRVLCEVEIHYVGNYPQIDRRYYRHLADRYVDDKTTFFVDEFIKRDGVVSANSVANHPIGAVTE